MTTIPQVPNLQLLSATAVEVRRVSCALCGAPPLEICQRSPRADHLQRWLDAYQAGRISKADLADVFAEVVVLTKWQVVPERSAA